MELAGALAREALAWRRRPLVPPLIRGDELAAALEIVPGPQLGRLLEEIEAARFAGDVATADDAVALARARLAAPADSTEKQ
jgi:hypothetical protein